MSDRFVCVRLVKCNSLDLGLFQFDYDLTFAAFFLNADRTIYARYGTRTSMDADRDVSLQGFASTMRAVLELHDEYPNNLDTLAGKQPKPVQKSRPEEFAALEHYKSTLDYSGQVAKSCIHCHQVRDAMRFSFRSQGAALPEKLLFPYPTPSSIGLSLDPQTKSTINAVEKATLADVAGLLVGDVLESVDGQLIASAADLQWVLHHKADGETLTMNISREGDSLHRTIALPQKWRSLSDISWRPSSWDMRRMSTGGMVLVDVTADERKQLGIESSQMALRVNHVGQYGNHAVAMRAGIRKNDFVVSFDDRTDLMTESDVIAYSMNHKKPGDVVSVAYIRDGQRRDTQIRLQ